MEALNKTREWPTIAVYDIETVSWVEVVLVCHSDEYGNQESFTNVSDYIDWLWADFEGTHVWAHAGGRFDHRFLLPEFQKRGYHFNVAMSGGSIVILRVWNDEKTIIFADSFRIMPNALKAIGKTVGLEKIEVDRSRIENLSEKEAKEYCFRDCEITLRGLQCMRDALGSVNADFAFTLASIASRWVRRGDSIDWYRMKARTEEREKQIKQAEEFCEPAYYGGRTEMFRRGTIKGPIYYYDIVSSYPTSMQFELPLYFKGFVSPDKKTPNKEDTIKFLNHPGVTEAWVSIPNTRIGPLPVRYGGRLIFPCGENIGRIESLEFPDNCPCCYTPLRSFVCRTCSKNFPREHWIPGRWTNVELLEAMKHGVKVFPIKQARYVGVPFLKPFVQTFYNLRQQAKDHNDSFKSYAYKICLNSLYGKLVETVHRTSYGNFEKDVENLVSAGAYVEATETPDIFKCESYSEGAFRHVAAGSYVTALSRIRLLDGLVRARKLGGRVLYCDTDSIMTDVELESSGLVGNKLGNWQKEHVFEEVEILLPKVYRAVDSKTKKEIFRCKGVPIVRSGESDSVSRERWEAFKKYSESEEEEMGELLKKTGISGLTSDIRSGSLEPREVSITRCLRNSDAKRVWKSDVDSWPIKL